MRSGPGSARSCLGRVYSLVGPRLAPPPPPPAGPEGGGGRPRGQARLAPPLPGPGAGARGEQRELLCPARARSRPARPSSSGARSRRAFRVSRCSCGNCRLFIPSGEKEGRWGGGPGRLRSGEGRHHLWAWRGERPQVLGRLPLGGFTQSKIFTAPHAHVSPAFPSPPPESWREAREGELGPPQPHSLFAPDSRCPEPLASWGHSIQLRGAWRPRSELEENSRTRKWRL
ncbi:trithorax group protein osa [Bos taurus]|uniref:trithorax group protein osa n=1 Tax=Bos taurus TaxID=9913 RepID=UPI0003840BEC|nr:trithorax group protein osa [Bos taurus]